MFGRKKNTPARVTDDMPIIVNTMPTTYGEMRGHALWTSKNGRNGVERGLAHAILFLLDEIEQRERATLERNEVGVMLRRRLAWSVGWKLLLLAAFATYFIGQELIGPWIFR